jgi:hypothetical protein
MAYSYDHRTRTAAFNISKVVMDIDVDLYPEKLSWTSSGKVLMTGVAEFVLPNRKHKSKPYELETSEDGTVQQCKCEDPMHRQMIWIAADKRKRELAELIEDQKQRGGLRRKP